MPGMSEPELPVMDLRQLAAGSQKSPSARPSAVSNAQAPAWPTPSLKKISPNYGRLEKLAIERICSQAGADAKMSLICCVPLEFEFFEVPFN